MKLRFRRTSHQSLSAIAGAALVSILTAPLAHASPTSGQCTPGKTAFVTSTATSFATGTTFVDIVQTKVNFTQGGNAASCVVVQFSAEALAPQSALSLRAVLDNASSGEPETVSFQYGDGTKIAAREFTFVFPQVPPGPHTIKMQIRSGEKGKSVTVYFHTTLVLHP